MGWGPDAAIPNSPESGRQLYQDRAHMYHMHTPNEPLGLASPIVFTKGGDRYLPIVQCPAANTVFFAHFVPTAPENGPNKEPYNYCQKRVLNTKASLGRWSDHVGEKHARLRGVVAKREIASSHTVNDSPSHFLRGGEPPLQFCHRPCRAFHPFRQSRFRFLLLDEGRGNEVRGECAVDRVLGCWARESKGFHPQGICQTAHGAL